jgi:hypothetical protein
MGKGNQKFEGKDGRWRIKREKQRKFFGQE